jgi:predicted  nucleic acid-binding Zn-ribbon protein
MIRCNCRGINDSDIQRTLSDMGEPFEEIEKTDPKLNSFYNKCAAAARARGVIPAKQEGNNSRCKGCPSDIKAAAQQHCSLA